MVDPQVEAIAGLSGDKCPWPGAGRPAWPVLARLDTRSSIVWPTAKIHFMRCAAAKSHMRAKLVVPVCKTNKLTTERVPAQRNQYSASEPSFNRENQPFDHGAVTGWLGAFTFHPAPNAPQSKMLSLSQIMYLGAAPA